MIRTGAGVTEIAKVDIVGLNNEGELTGVSYCRVRQ